MGELEAAVSGSVYELAGGEEAERGGSSSARGNQWPWQETLVLLKSRSGMDAAFREAAAQDPVLPPSCPSFGRRWTMVAAGGRWRLPAGGRRVDDRDLS